MIRKESNLAKYAWYLAGSLAQVVCITGFQENLWNTLCKMGGKGVKLACVSYKRRKPTGIRAYETVP